MLVLVLLAAAYAAARIRAGSFVVIDQVQTKPSHAHKQLGGLSMADVHATVQEALGRRQSISRTDPDYYSSTRLQLSSTLVADDLILKATSKLRAQARSPSKTSP